MKKNIFLLSAIIAFAIIGCQKDDVKTTSNSKSAEQDSYYESVLNRVDTFKEKLKSDFKREELMSVDSAVWYVEAALNLTYGSAVSATETIDGSFVKVVSPNAQGELSMSNIAEVYDGLLRDISQTYYSNDAERFGLVDVYSRTNESGELEIIGDYSIAAAIIPTLPPYRNGFLENGTDNWWAIDKRGRSDGAFVGHDAASELTRRYTDFHIGYFPANVTFVNVSHDLYNGKRLWYGVASQEIVNEVVDGLQLNSQYQDHIPYIIGKNLETRPNYVCFKILIRPDTVVSRYDVFVRHVMDSYYGIKVVVRPGQQLDIPRY